MANQQVSNAYQAITGVAPSASYLIFFGLFLATLLLILVWSIVSIMRGMKKKQVSIDEIVKHMLRVFFLLCVIAAVFYVQK